LGVREPDGVTQATLALPALCSCCSVSLGVGAAVAETVATGGGDTGGATRNLWPPTPAKKPATTSAAMLIAGERPTYREAPSTTPAEKHCAPARLIRQCLLVVERLGQPAAALREQQAGTIQRIGRLVKRSNFLMQAGFAGNHGGAGQTLCCVSLERRTHAGSSSSQA